MTIKSLHFIEHVGLITIHLDATSIKTIAVLEISNDEGTTGWRVTMHADFDPHGFFESSWPNFFVNVEAAKYAVLAFAMESETREW